MSNETKERKWRRGDYVTSNSVSGYLDVPAPSLAAVIPDGYVVMHDEDDRRVHMVERASLTNHDATSAAAWSKNVEGEEIEGER